MFCLYLSNTDLVGKCNIVVNFGLLFQTQLKVILVLLSCFLAMVYLFEIVIKYILGRHFFKNRQLFCSFNFIEFGFYRFCSDLNLFN